MESGERQLIASLFERLQTVRSAPKDQDADLFIRDALERFPDAPYFLVQSVLVQDQALQRADARIRELEETARRGSDAPTGDTSFLGGARDSSRGGLGSQPRIDPTNEGPWSRSAAASQTDNRSGSFLSSAISTATGVAGGLFLADGIRSLFGSVGGRSYFGGGDAVSSADQARLDRAQDNEQDAEEAAQKARNDLAADDATLDDAQDADDDDDDGDWSDDGIDV